MELFWISGSPFSWRALLALQVKNAAYRSRLLEASKRETRTAAFRALNPRGKVPTLRDGDLVLSESLAILAYLDRKLPDPPLFGTSPAETGRIWMAVSEFDSYVQPLMTRVILPIFFGEADQKADDIRAAATEVRDELALLETALDGRDWLVGSAISAADIAVYPFVEGLLRAAGKEAAQPFDLALLPFERRYPALAAWRARIAALPGYAETYPPHWRDAA